MLSFWSDSDLPRTGADGATRLLVALTDSRRSRKGLELWRLLGLERGLCAAWVYVCAAAVTCGDPGY